MVENLEGDTCGLVENDAPVLGVSVQLLVVPLVDKPVSEGIEHNGVYIRDAVGSIGEFSISEHWCFSGDWSLVTTTPVPERHRANLQRHSKSVALIDRRAAHFRVVPRPAEILRPPCRVAFEAAGAKDDTVRLDLFKALGPADLDADNMTLPVHDEFGRRALVADLNPFPLNDVEPHF